jgi:hypothetical protein
LKLKAQQIFFWYSFWYIKLVEKNNPLSFNALKHKLVRLEGEALNQLFSVLGEWNRNLMGCFKEFSTPASLSESPHGHSPDM